MFTLVESFCRCVCFHVHLVLVLSDKCGAREDWLPSSFPPACVHVLCHCAWRCSCSLGQRHLCWSKEELPAAVPTSSLSTPAGGQEQLAGADAGEGGGGGVGKVSIDPTSTNIIIETFSCMNPELNLTGVHVCV